MDIQVDTTGPFAVARLSGELNAQHVDAFTEQLQEFAHGDGAQLVLDLSGLALINSIGLSAMINLVTRSRLSNGTVVLVGPTAFVRGILEVTRLDRWFEVFDSIEEAAQRLSTN